MFCRLPVFNILRLGGSEDFSILFGDVLLTPSIIATYSYYWSRGALALASCITLLFGSLQTIKYDRFSSIRSKIL